MFIDVEYKHVEAVQGFMAQLGRFPKCMEKKKRDENVKLQQHLYVLYITSVAGLLPL